jgi:hypothetical protein
MRARSTTYHYALFAVRPVGRLANSKPPRFESSGSVQLLLSTMLSHGG